MKGHKGDKGTTGSGIQGRNERSGVAQLTKTGDSQGILSMCYRKTLEAFHLLLSMSKRKKKTVKHEAHKQ